MCFQTSLHGQAKHESEMQLLFDDDIESGLHRVESQEAHHTPPITEKNRACSEVHWKRREKSDIVMWWIIEPYPFRPPARRLR
jgi:hypothetical protein